MYEDSQAPFAPLFRSILKIFAVNIHRCLSPPTAKADNINILIKRRKIK